MEQMTIKDRHPSSKALIRFQDCDPFGHLNNARYLDYFINAREDHLRESYGIDIYKISRERGFGWVVVQNQIAYFKPALLMEQVEISSTVIHYDRYSILVELKMENTSKQELKSVLWTKFVSVDLKSAKRVEIPGDLFARLDEMYVDKVDVQSGFELRVGQLLGKLK